MEVGSGDGLGALAWISGVRPFLAFVPTGREGTGGEGRLVYTAVRTGMAGSVRSANDMAASVGRERHYKRGYFTLFQPFVRVDWKPDP